MTDPNYSEALDYLYSFIDYSVKRRYRYSPEVLDLNRVRRLLALLGDPQDAYPTVHVAGTKGKGSVCAMIASALRSAGYCTGLYTSPHMQCFTERIRINGNEISESTFASLMEEIKPSVEAIPGLTVFEIATALMFVYFSRQEVDCAVIEVGLGGRLDATNVLIPQVSVITSLSYDHMHLLGNSLSDIAREKAGIIKTRVPVVVAPQQFEAARVVEDVARAKQAPLIRIGRDWHFSAGTHNLENQSLYIWSDAERPLMEAYVESGGGEEWIPPRYGIPLLGYHQVINCATARVVLEILRDKGWRIPEEDIQRGFREASLPGRFQILTHDPFVVVDSAHNRDSALRLRIALDDYFPGQPVTLIFGASADKDIRGMLGELLPRVSRLILTQAVHPRAASTEALAELANGYGLHIESIVPVIQALRHGIEMARPGEVVLAAGSLFVVGEILATREFSTNRIAYAKEEVE